MSNAVEHRVEEHRLPGCAGGAVGTHDEVDGLVPVEVGGEGLMEDVYGAIVGGVDGVYGAEGDLVEVGFGEAGYALGPAEFDGNDVLKKLGCGDGAGYVTGNREDFGVGG